MPRSRWSFTLEGAAFTAALFRFSAPAAAQTAEVPRRVVATATAAVVGDSADRLRRRWALRLARDSTDRAARLGAATIDRLRYDYPESERAYRALADGAGDGYAVYARLGLAEGLEERRYSQAARAEFERARVGAGILGDRTAEGEALLWLAFIRGRLEGVGVADALLDSAAARLPPGDLGLRSELQSRRAITLAIRGKPAEALEAAKGSIALARRGRSLSAEADAYRVLGQVLQYRGRWDSAFGALARSESLYVGAKRRSALAASLIWHAQVLGSVARYGQMREVMQRALVEGEATHNPAAVADAERAFGVLASMFGDWPAAAAHLRASLATSTETGDSSGAQFTRKYLARVALAAGDLATARRLTSDYLASGRRSGDPIVLFEANLTLAAVADQEGDWPAGSQSLDAARSQLRLLPGDIYRMHLAVAEARHALARGDLPAADRLLQAFLRGEAGPIGPVVAFDARVRLADVRARLGDPAAAERELAEATDDLDRWRAQLSDVELRKQAFQLRATIDGAAAEPGVSAAAAGRVLAAMITAGRVDAAFSLTERWRARELADHLNRASALGGGEPGVGGSGGAARMGPLGAADVMAAIPDDRVAVIEFVAVEGGPVSALVVQRHGTWGAVLAPADSLNPLIDRFGALVESGADPSRLGRDLAERLVDPILPLIDSSVTRLVVVPDGPLHRLPFEALRLADGRYLLERFGIALAPSASVAAAFWAQRSRAPSAAPLRLLAFGDPRPGGRGSWAGPDTSARGDPSGALAPLPGAAREARAVARYAPASVVRVGRDASARYLTHADLRSFRVIHFAAHAIVDDRTLGGAALVLASDPGQSGVVGVGEIAGLRLDADLVVLSACRSAAGRWTVGEGVQGLTSAFLHAGARTVVATHWRIADERTVGLVDRFYAGLARGESVIDALREAKLDALRRGAPPSEWAAFVAIGDPLSTVPLQPPAPPSLWSRVAGAVRP